jgi:glutamyl-tRNA reductase
MQQADIVVASTNSPHHLIERNELELVMEARGGKPLLMIDLAVPRDIDPGCREVPAVSLYDVDDVQAMVERNASGREAEAVGSRPIIDAELATFERWLASQEVVPTVAALRERADSIVEQVLAENSSRWESLSEADRERLTVMAKAIAGRILHEPTLRIKDAADRDDAYLYVAALRELFGLDAGTEPVQDEDAEVTSLDEARRDRDRG